MSFFFSLVDGTVSEVIHCKFIRENECVVVLSYPFFCVDIFVFLVSLKISGI